MRTTFRCIQGRDTYIHERRAEKTDTRLRTVDGHSISLKSHTEFRGQYYHNCFKERFTHRPLSLWIGNNSDVRTLFAGTRWRVGVVATEKNVGDDVNHSLRVDLNRREYPCT